MAMFQHIFMPWICGFIFLILLALQFDDKLKAVWFIVFIPLFVLDLFQIASICFNLVMQIRNRRIGGQDTSSRKRKCWDLFVWLCLTCFQVLLCFRLEMGRSSPVKMYFVIIPLLIVLVGYNIDLMRYQIRVIKRARDF